MLYERLMSISDWDVRAIDEIWRFRILASYINAFRSIDTARFNLLIYVQDFPCLIYPIHVHSHASC